MTGVPSRTPHLPRPPPPEPTPRALAEVPGHIDQVHGIHLFGDRLLSLRARSSEVEVQITYQKWMSTLWALAPSLVVIHQCFQVGGWDVTSHDEKSD